MNKAISSCRHDAAVPCHDDRMLMLGDKGPWDIGKDRIDVKYLRPDQCGESEIQFLLPKPAAGKRQPVAILDLFE